MIGPLVIRPGGSRRRVPLGEAVRIREEQHGEIAFGRMVRRIDAAEEAAIVAEYLEGHNLRKVARAHHISDRRAIGILDRAGVPRPMHCVIVRLRDEAPARQLEPEILRRPAAGERCTDIAADLHIGRRRVESILREARHEGRA